MKEVNIVIQDEDSKVLISMKPEDEDKMTTNIEFEPEIALKESPTDAQYIGVQYLVDDMDIEVIGNIHEDKDLLGQEDE